MHGSLWQEENQISWVRCCVCAAPLVYGAAESNRALSARRRWGNSQLAAESRAAVSASISAGHAVSSALPPVPWGSAPLRLGQLWGKLQLGGFSGSWEPKRWDREGAAQVLSFPARTDAIKKKHQWEVYYTSQVRRGELKPSPPWQKKTNPSLVCCSLTKEETLSTNRKELR